MSAEIVQFRRSKRLNAPVNQVGELQKRWDNRLILEGLSLAEAYLHGRISILLVMAIGRASSSDRLLLPLTIPQEKSCAVPSGRGIVFVKNNLVGEAADPCHHYKESVLVLSIEMVEAVKTRLPTVAVRFDLLRDDFGHVRRVSLYKSVLHGFYERVPRIVHREVETGYVTIAPSDDFGGGVVQGRTKIMNGVANNGSDFFIDIEGRPTCAYDVAGFASVRVGAAGVKVVLNKGTMPVFDLVDVLVGPFDL